MTRRMTAAALLVTFLCASTAGAEDAASSGEQKSREEAIKQRLYAQAQRVSTPTEVTETEPSGEEREEPDSDTTTQHTQKAQPLPPSAPSVLRGVPPPPGPSRPAPQSGQGGGETIITTDDAVSRSEYLDRERMNTPQIVMPEVVSPVTMSSSDVNRVRCDNVIKDVIFSKEKGVTVTYSGSDAYVKFLITKKGVDLHYSQTPSELYIVCGESVYTLIALPSRVPAQTIRLAAHVDRIKKNVAIYGSIPFEKKVLDLIARAYREDYPESFTVVKLNKTYAVFDGLVIRESRSVIVEGEGLLLREFVLSATGSLPLEMVEKDFLKTAITTSPAGISLESHRLEQGASTRLFIVERGGAK